MNAPCTTFARGVNPFQGLGALPSTQPEPAMQKTAKPSKIKTKLKDEDYSTPYKPPMEPVEPAPATQPRQPTAYIDPAGLEIKDDPLPAHRASHAYKYHQVFDRMKPGQCVRCTTADVGKVSGALRKYLELKGKKCQVRSVVRYAGDEGYGRVWMLAEPVKALKVAA